MIAPPNVLHTDVYPHGVRIRRYCTRAGTRVRPNSLWIIWAGRGGRSTN